MNPEPLAPFFDAFVIGEGEDVIPIIIDLVRQYSENRRDLLDALARVPGIYVPLVHPGVWASLSFLFGRIHLSPPARATSGGRVGMGARGASVY